MEKLQRYDLNCNIFDVYNYDGLSMQELLCQFFTKINECVELCDNTESLAEWLVNEGLNKEVSLLLTKWLNDGTLSDIISEELLNSLTSKLKSIEFKNEISRHIKEYEEYVVNGDYSIAINTAINDIVLNGGGILHIDGDVYNCLNTINLDSRCRIQGIKEKSVINFTTKGITCVNMNNNNLPKERNTNITILKDITLHGMGKHFSQIGVDLGTWGSRLEDLVIKGFEIGVKLSGVKNRISDCYINNCKTAIEITKQQESNVFSTMLDINNNLIHYNDLGVNCYSSEIDVVNLIIENNAFEFNGKALNIRGVMDLNINRNWFESNNEKPFIHNYSVGLTDNRYNTLDQTPLLNIEDKRYSGYTSTNVGGNIDTKYLNLQDYSTGTLEIKALTHSNGRFEINNSTIQTVQNTTHTPTKKYFISCKGENVINTNIKESSFSIRKVSTGVYVIEFTKEIVKPLIQIEGYNINKNWNVVRCYINLQNVSQPTRYEDSMIIDRIEVYSYSNSSNTEIDCSFTLILETDTEL